MARKKNAWTDFAQDAESIISRSKCGVATAIESHVPDAERANVFAALENPALASASIGRALRKRIGDFAPSGYTIGRHRRRECACFRTETEQGK